MSKEIKKSNTPEEQELEEKLQELSNLETELAQQELDLTTLTAELQALESRYARIVGSKLLELDWIKAKIAKLVASQNPDDETARVEAEQAQAKADNTSQEMGDASEMDVIETFKPTKELRDLYRKIAKKIHPDLAVDDEDRNRRTEIMAEVNKAYQEGDIEKLRAILREWESSPEAIEGEDIGSKLIRTIRMIARVRERINQIGQEIRNLMEADLYELKQKVDEAAREGRDLITEIADRITAEIEQEKARLGTLLAVDANVPQFTSEGEGIESDPKPTYDVRGYPKVRLPVEFPCQSPGTMCNGIVTVDMGVGPAAFECPECRSIYYVHVLVEGPVTINNRECTPHYFYLDPEDPKSRIEVTNWAMYPFRKAQDHPRKYVEAKIGSLDNFYYFVDFPEGSFLLSRDTHGPYWN